MLFGIIIQAIVGCVCLVLGLYLIFIDKIDVWMLQRYHEKLGYYKTVVQDCLLANQDVPQDIIDDINFIDERVHRIIERRHK